MVKMEKIVVKRKLRGKEKNGNTGLEPFNVTLVTMEEFDSSNVTLVNFNATLVTLENFKSSDVPIVSEDKNIMEANLTSDLKPIARTRMEGTLPQIEVEKECLDKDWEKRSIGEIQLLEELWIEDNKELATIEDDTEVTSI